MADKPYLLFYPLPDDQGQLKPAAIDPQLYMVVARAVIGIVAASSDETETEEIDRVVGLMMFGAMLAKRDRLTDPEIYRLRYAIGYFVKLAMKEKWKEDTDPAMSLCYYLVHNNHISYRAAFDLAKSMLGPGAMGFKAEPKSEKERAANIKAFRKRLSRWAQTEERNLGQVVPIGRPRKQKATDQG